MCIRDRIYYGVENDLGCPLTVREGRNWLTQLLSLIHICQAFEALSDEDKALVSEIKQAKLNSAVLKIAELRAENSKQTWQQIYDATGMYIASIIEDDVQYGNEWSIIGLARAGKLDETAAAAYYDNIVDTLKDNGSAKLKMCIRDRDGRRPLCSMSFCR